MARQNRLRLAAYIRVKAGNSKASRGLYKRAMPFFCLAFRDVDSALGTLLQVDDLFEASCSGKTIMEADEYLDMAYDAGTPEQAVKYAKKALKRDKNCLDAKLLIIELNHTDDAEKAKLELEKAISYEKKRLEGEGFFDEDSVGVFYGMIETRPYMRAVNSYVELLMAMGKIKKAVRECERLIELNANDNMGIRYKLMTLYAMLEDKESAEALCEKYENEESFMILYPKALLYYKLDDYKTLKPLTRKLAKANSDYKKFLTGEIPMQEEEIEEIMGQGMYAPDTIEEVLLCFRDNSLLFSETACFNEWALQEFERYKK